VLNSDFTSRASTATLPLLQHKLLRNKLRGTLLLHRGVQAAIGKGSDSHQTVKDRPLPSP
jgi:hypothetical protein